MKWLCKTEAGAVICKRTAEVRISGRHYPCPACCGFTTLERQGRVRAHLDERQLVTGRR